MSSSSGNREIIRLSFGNISNSLSSHLINLEGLSSTTFTSSNSASLSPLCNPTVTHRTSSSSDTLLPRIVFCDTVEQYGPLLSSSNNPDGEGGIFSWNGTVEVHRTGEERRENDPFREFREMAQTVVNFTNRYEIKKEVQQGRHYNWDDLEDEEEEEYEEEENEEMQLRKERERRETISNTEQELSTKWEQCTSNSTNISWYDYLLPPFPPIHPSIVTLSSRDDDKNRLTMETIQDSIRILLEECDALSGFQILFSSLQKNEILFDEVLQYIEEECKSAGRWTIQLFEHDDDDNKAQKWKLMSEFRQNLNFATLLEHSHVVLPLHFSSSSSKFHSTAQGAQSLHSLCLPYRLSPSPSNTLSYYNTLSDTFQPKTLHLPIQYTDLLSSLQQFNYNVLELEVGSSLQQLQSISSPMLSPLTPLPQDERSSIPIRQTYHSLYCSSQHNTTTISCQQMMKEYQPTQCSVFRQPSFSSDPHYAYWKSMPPSPSISLLSNSTRSYDQLRNQISLMKRLCQKEWFWMDMEKEEGLERLELLENVGKLYARRSIWEDEEDEGFYFEDNED